MTPQHVRQHDAQSRRRAMYLTLLVGVEKQRGKMPPPSVWLHDPRTGLRCPVGLLLTPAAIDALWARTKKGTDPAELVGQHPGVPFDASDLRFVDDLYDAATGATPYARLASCGHRWGVVDAEDGEMPAWVSEELAS